MNYRPLSIKEIVERMAWKLCAMENEVWDEVPEIYQVRYRREAAQMLVSKRFDKDFEIVAQDPDHDHQ